MTDGIAKIEDRLNKLKDYCGCAEGSIAAILSALVWFLLAGLGLVSESMSLWTVVAWGCLLFFVGGLVGKSIALSFVNLYRKQLVARLQQMNVKHE